MTTPSGGFGAAGSSGGHGVSVFLFQRNRHAAGGANRNTGAFTTQIFPPNGAHHFGISLAAGDLTGDGIDDILIGAPGPDSPIGPGQAFVIEGGRFQDVIDLSGPDTPRCVVTGLGFSRLHGTLEVEFQPLDGVRVCVGDLAWIAFDGGRR